MKTVCIDWTTAHQHGPIWISQHRLRHRIFIERNGWDLPSYNGLEYDQFDTPVAKYLVTAGEDRAALGVMRLIPTSYPYMVQALWPDLLDACPPSDPSIWEASRFGCTQELPPSERKKVVGSLICAALEYGLRNKIRAYIGVMQTRILYHVLQMAGCIVRNAGPTRQVEGKDISAAYIDIDHGVLNKVRNILSIREPSLHSCY